MIKSNQYSSIDGLRVVAALGIIIMHISANSNYLLYGVIYERIVPFFAAYVFLFMIISAFGVSCGYYEKFNTGLITPYKFYEKRYSKILPYFMILVLLNLVMEPSKETLIESIADLTLCFGLLPNADIKVIGVGWFLGIVFVFYMLFPFFTFLMRTKKRIWLAFAITIFYNISCTEYFMNSAHIVKSLLHRSNFLFSSMYFMVGCVIFMYKEQLILCVQRFRWIILSIVAIITFGYFIVPNRNTNISYLWIFVMFSSWLIYAIGVDSKILYNPVTNFLSSISMEIYLYHIVIFRLVERLHLNYLFGTGYLSYITTVVIVFIGTVIFSLCAKWFLKKIEGLISKRKVAIS